MASSGDSVKAYAELSLALSEKEPIPIHSNSNNNNNFDSQSSNKKKSSPPSSEDSKTLENSLFYGQYINSAYRSPVICARQRTTTTFQGVSSQASEASSQEFENLPHSSFAKRRWKNLKKSLPSGMFDV
ncbi:uncharacterized protein [Palaemon carinicauda]|uniref:uncharacterized protein n=1 Tax=Palaemon carinicauda TaxID=392227 RepID=UPI0035B61F99